MLRIVEARLRPEPDAGPGLAGALVAQPGVPALLVGLPELDLVCGQGGYDLCHLVNPVLHFTR